MKGTADVMAQFMFKDLPLHDATLRRIQLDWAAASCSLSFSSQTSERCELNFSGVSELLVPRKQPWGPSVSVNSLRESDDKQFEIEMQSGDILRIAAVSWAFDELDNKDTLEHVR